MVTFSGKLPKMAPFGNNYQNLGFKAAGVPGELAGYWVMYTRFGSGTKFRLILGKKSI